MGQKYIDFVDVAGSLKHVAKRALKLGPVGQDKNLLAITGILGDGYFVRGDAFTRKDGKETHRVYVTEHEMIGKLIKKSTR